MFEQSVAEGIDRRSSADVAAIVLTHAHFDHIGFAERARRDLRISVWVHENDVPLTRHPSQYAHERSRLLYMGTKPKAMPIVGSFLRTRAFWPTPAARSTASRMARSMCPGSRKSSSRPVIRSGNARSTSRSESRHRRRRACHARPVHGDSGPAARRRAATADSDRALASLDAPAETGAETVLTGHGPRWNDGVESAVEKAAAAGAD